MSYQPSMKGGSIDRDYRITLHSEPYKPIMACEKCVFGTGVHSDSCTVKNDATASKSASD